MNQEFYNIIDKICEQDTRYRPDAYEFVMEALSFTQKKLSRNKHVSGTELLDGIKDLLMQKFGPMTMSVLTHWGINRTEDFGHIVFNLVQERILSKDKDDDIAHFCNGYDFHEVFNNGYRNQLAKRISRMRSI